MQKISGLGVLAVLACLTQSVMGSYYNWTYGEYYGGYNNYRSNNYNSITYSGTAWGINSAGEYAQMPVSSCPGGCAVNGACADETTCTVSSIILAVVLSIFGCIFLTVGCVFCCVCCRAAKHSIKHAGSHHDSHHESHHEPLLHDSSPSVTVYPAATPNTATYYAQPGYAQQQPGYVQQQAGYPQQQPGQAQYYP